MVTDKYVITIARGFGSGGRTIGKLLAKELGINYYDRELLRLASDESGINEALFERSDEQIRNSLLYRIARRAYKGEIIPPDSETLSPMIISLIFNQKLLRNWQIKSLV